jgi:hypothetical protein
MGAVESSERSARISASFSSHQASCSVMCRRLPSVRALQPWALPSSSHRSTARLRASVAGEGRQRADAGRVERSVPGENRGPKERVVPFEKEKAYSSRSAPFVA